MKALMIYFTMGGRTKKIAEAITSTLVNYEVNYFPMELTGKLTEKIKMLDKFENKDFSMIENELSAIDALPYDLLISGMPTYGNFPPKVFDEILVRMRNIRGKRTIIFNTARFTGKKSLDYMKAKLEEVGAQVIDQSRFRKLLWVGTKNVIEFGKQINESLE